MNITGDALPPPLLAGYSQLAFLDAGGLGRVYRARKDSTGGFVAIKELMEASEAPRAWTRARRELEAMLRLKGHPYVVAVEEIVEGPRGPCIVMEYLPAGSIRARMGDGPLPLAEVVLIGQQVSHVLKDAHQLRILHRDIKPQNLLVSSFGQVKVCDFGIAALARGSGAVTHTNAMTLAYASPEELDQAADIGPASDVYSLCATLKHVLTGVKPSHRSPAHGLAPSASGGTAEDIAIDLIISGLAPDPSERPTTAELIAGFDSAAAALGDARLTQLVVAAPATPHDEVTVPRPAFPGDPSATPASRKLPALGDVPTHDRDAATTFDAQISGDTPPSRRTRQLTFLVLAILVGAAGLVRAIADEDGEAADATARSSAPPTGSRAGIELAEPAEVAPASASSAVGEHHVSVLSAGDAPSTGAPSPSPELAAPTTTSIALAATTALSVTPGQLSFPLVPGGDWPNTISLAAPPDMDAGSWAPLAQGLSDRLGVGVEVVETVDLASTIAALASGHAHIAGGLGPVQMLRARQDVGAEMILQSVRSGESSYVVQWFTNDPARFCRDTPVLGSDGFKYCNGVTPGARLSDPSAGAGVLAGADSLRVAFVAEGSASGYQVPAMQMIDVGVDGYESIFTGSHDGAVVAVYSGEADVGVSYRDARSVVVGQFPDIGERVVVFGLSPAIPNDGFIVSNTLPDDMRSAIAAALVDFAESPDGAHVMSNLYAIDGVVPIDATQFAYYDRLLRELTTVPLGVRQS